MITIPELADKIDVPVSWVERHIVSPKKRPQVMWDTFPEESDFYRVCSLLNDIGEPYEHPFIDRAQIIVRMSDDWAFIFNLNGKRV